MCVDAETLKRLLDAHSAALALFVRQWCDTPEDIVQDVFLLLMRERSVPKNVVGWLYGAARNKAINAAKSARRRARREAQTAQRAKSWLVSPDADRLDAAVAAEALAELPLDQREVIVARLWGGLSLAETADLLGASLSTAYRRYQQGIAALRERLDGRCQQMKTRR
jgi:RNA polymerase sigma-70 factor (ECF subfamily)